MAAPYPNFAAEVRYSDEENVYYDEIFNKFKDQPDRMDAKKAAEILLGTNLEKKDLSRLWNTVCPHATSVTKDNFKLFCKYCSVYGRKLPFEANQFSQHAAPIDFPKMPQAQEVGMAAVRKLQDEKQAAARAQQGTILTNPGQGMGAYGASQYGSVPVQTGNPTYGAPQGYGSVHPTYGTQPTTPAYNTIPPNPQGFPAQSQYGFSSPAGPYSQNPMQVPQAQQFPQNPNQVPQPVVIGSTPTQSRNSGTSTPHGEYSIPGTPTIRQGAVSSAEFVVTGTDCARFLPEDYVKIKGLVSRIPTAAPEIYTFEELKPIIMGFNLSNTKEYTRFWKLVDITGTKKISIESAVTLFWLLSLAKKGVEIPTGLPPNLDTYIKNKVPPSANLETAALSSSTATSRVKQLEEQYLLVHSNADNEVSKFKEENRKSLQRDQAEINKIRMLAARIRQAKEQLTAENQDLRVKTETLRRVNLGGQSNQDLGEFIRQSEVRGAGVQQVVQRLIEDTRKMLEREKELELKVSTANIKINTLQESIKDHEAKGLKANFGMEVATHPSSSTTTNQTKNNVNLVDVDKPLADSVGENLFDSKVPHNMGQILSPSQVDQPEEDVDDFFNASVIPVTKPEVHGHKEDDVDDMFGADAQKQPADDGLKELHQKHDRDISQELRVPGTQAVSSPKPAQDQPKQKEEEHKPADDDDDFFGDVQDSRAEKADDRRYV